MSAQRSPIRRLLRFVLALLAVVGCGYSIYFNRLVSELRQFHADLRARVGLLEVEDPSKVSITRVPFSEDAIPPGVNEAYVWQYRIHLPANFGACYQTQNGLVKADSPQGRGGSSSNWSSPKPEAYEVLATMALIHSDGKWLFCRTADGGSSAYGIPDDFKFESLDELVVEPVVEEGETRVFDADEAICLLRLREKELATNRAGAPEKDLYRGFVVYFFSRQHEGAFTAWASGRASSMQEGIDE